MSLETITIVRQFPIINGFVQLPNNLEKNVTEVSLEEALVALPAAVIANLTADIGGRRLAGGKFGIQEWLETEETFSCCPTPVDDGAETLKDEIPSNTTQDDDDCCPPGDTRWNEMPCECTREFDGTTFMVDLVNHSGIAGCCVRVPDLTASSVLLISGDNCLWTAIEQDYGFVLELVTNDDGTCYWSLEITCPDTTSIWSGTKLTGSSPAGTYAGITGCATTDYPTITIV